MYTAYILYVYNIINIHLYFKKLSELLLLLSMMKIRYRKKTVDIPFEITLFAIYFPKDKFTEVIYIYTIYKHSFSKTASSTTTGNDGETE